MAIQNIGLFKAISAKMGYLNYRHDIISQNIANADTPGYRPKDLRPVDFGKMVTGDTQIKTVDLDKTNPMHASKETLGTTTSVGKWRDMYEVAPSDNSVILEEQLMASRQNTLDYDMAINLYQKNVSMYKTALGINNR